MPIKLSANVIKNLNAQGVSPSKISELQQSAPPLPGGFLDIPLEQPLSRQFSNESTLFNPFVDKQLVVVNNQVFLLDSGLGQGNFGAVYKGVNLETGEESAIKFSDVSKEDDGTYSIPLENERKTLAKKGELLGSGQGPGKKSDDNNCHLTIMPLVKGPNLEDTLYTKHKNATGDITHVTKNTLPLVEKLIIAAQILDELENLHNIGVLHRDFKPDNMHWDSASKKLTVIDFGETHHMAKAMPIPDTYSTQEEYHAGSYLYSSPEALEHRNYSVKSDGYSAGLVLADLFCDYNLLQDKNDKAEMKAFQFESDRNPAIINELLNSVAKMGKTADTNGFISQAIYSGTVRPLVNPDPLARANIGSTAKYAKSVATSLFTSKSAVELGLSDENERFQLITKFNSSLAEKKITLILNNPDNQDFLSKYNKSAIIGTSHHIADALNTLRETLSQKGYTAVSPKQDFEQNIEIGKAVVALERELASLPQDHPCARDISSTLIDIQKDINLNCATAYVQLQSLTKDKNTPPNLEQGLQSIMAKLQSFHETGKMSQTKAQETIVRDMDNIVSKMETDNTKSKQQEKIVALFEDIKSNLKLPAASQHRQAASIAAASSSSSTDYPVSPSSSSTASPPIPSLDLTNIVGKPASFSPRPGTPQARELFIHSDNPPERKREEKTELAEGQTIQQDASNQVEKPSRARSKSFLTSFSNTVKKENDKVASDSATPSVRFADDPLPSRTRSTTANSTLASFKNHKEKTQESVVKKSTVEPSSHKEEEKQNKNQKLGK